MKTPQTERPTSRYLSNRTENRIPKKFQQCHVHCSAVHKSQDRKTVNQVDKERGTYVSTLLRAQAARGARAGKERGTYVSTLRYVHRPHVPRVSVLARARAELQTRKSAVCDNGRSGVR